MGKKGEVPSDVFLATRRLNQKENLCITVTKYEGKDFLHVRRWQLREGRVPVPGKNGLVMRPEDFMLLYEVVQEAKANLEASWRGP